MGIQSSYGQHLGPHCQLINFVGNNGLMQYGIPLSSSLSLMWVGESWDIGQTRSQEMEQVQVYLSTITLSDSMNNPE